MHMVAARQQARRLKERAQDVQVVQSFLDSAKGVKKRHAHVKVVQGRRLRRRPKKQDRFCMQTNKLKLVMRTSRGSKRIPVGQAIEVAFAKRFSSTAMSCMHDMSRRSILRCTMAGVMAYLACQGLMMEKLLAAMRMVPPDFVIVHQAWDETGERLKVRAPGCQTKHEHDDN